MEARRRKQRLHASNEAYLYENELNNRDKALPQKSNVLQDICEEVGHIRCRLSYHNNTEDM